MSVGKDANSVIYLGTGTSFNVSTISGYENFTTNNFIIGAISGGGAQKSNMEGCTQVTVSSTTLSKSYDASKGKLTISGYNQSITCAGNGYATNVLKCAAWYVSGDIIIGSYNN